MNTKAVAICFFVDTVRFKGINLTHILLLQSYLFFVENKQSRTKTCISALAKIKPGTLYTVYFVKYITQTFCSTTLLISTCTSEVSYKEIVGDSTYWFVLDLMVNWPALLSHVFL